MVASSIDAVAGGVRNLPVAVRLFSAADTEANNTVFSPRLLLAVSVTLPAGTHPWSAV
jgi:hypothetical protein